MAGWVDAGSSPHQPNATYTVNNFGFAPVFGPFHGDGRRRTVDRSAAARERRDEAATIAEMLVEGGLDPDEVYLAPAEVADIMLALDGSDFRDCLGRPRRAWAGYPDHAHALKTRIGREYSLFAEALGIERVTQVVIRPPDASLPLSELSAWHARNSKTLGDMLRYARRTRASGFVWDLVSAEVTNAGRGGWKLDGHFHLTTRGADAETLERIRAYFVKGGWTFWFTPDDHEAAGDHPVALVQYQSKGLAEAVGDGATWRADALAELRRQTRNLAMTRATGPFRTWKAEIARQGLTAVEDESGRPMLASRRVVRHRLRRKLRGSASVVALRFCVHDFGDGLFRRALRVRGEVGTVLADVLAAYDFDGLTLLKGDTAIPESILSARPFAIPTKTTDPPGSDPSGQREGGIP